MQQAIIFQDNRPIGVLTKGKLRVTEEPAWEAQVVGLHFACWQPARGGKQVKALHIPVDSAFSSAGFRASILGRIKGRAYAGPAFSWSGVLAAASLSQHEQRLSYIAKQRLHQGVAAPVVPVPETTHTYTTGTTRGGSVVA
jgi:hypothetical protein